MGDIIVSICLGFLSGLIARALHPGKDDMGILMTAILGISGSIVAQWLGLLLGIYQKGSSAGFLASIIGAILLLFIYGQIQKSKKNHNPLIPNGVPNPEGSVAPTTPSDPKV